MNILNQFVQFAVIIVIAGIGGSCQFSFIATIRCSGKWAAGKIVRIRYVLQIPAFKSLFSFRHLTRQKGTYDDTWQGH